jgi:hypothetical protein
MKVLHRLPLSGLAERAPTMTDTIILDTLIDAELHPVPLTDRERLVHLANVYASWGDGYDPDPDVSWLEPEPED